MGLFRKTLRHAKAFAERGRWDQVIEIIEKHRNDELIIHKDLSALVAAIQSYIQSIRVLQTILRQVPKDRSEILRGLADLEFDLDRIEDLIKKLIKDKKLVL